MENNDANKAIMFFRSKGFALALKIFIALAVALLVFQLGMYVGFRKASYAFGWGDNYHRVFGGPQGGVLRDLTGRDFMSGHGTAGTVAEIDGNSIIIKGGDGMEKAVTVGDNTRISAGHATITINDIKTGDDLTIIGQPNADGTINAEIIRMFGQAFDMNVPPPLPPQQ